MITNSQDTITQRGSELLESNKFFADLTKLMKNLDFRKVYNEYFINWSDIQVMIFYMKLYSTIETEYYRRYSNAIQDETMVYMLHQIMSNSSMRKYALSLFSNFKENSIISNKSFCNLIDFS